MATVHWKMTTHTYNRYVELSREMMAASKDNDTMRFEAAKDAFRALPGFPAGLHPDLDQVVPVIDDKIHRILSIGRIQ